MMDSKKDGVVKAIGLMSGTSLDGIDAAVLETDGEEFVSAGRALTRPFSPALRARLRAALDEAVGTPTGVELSETLRETELLLTAAHADAVKILLSDAGLAAGEIAATGRGALGACEAVGAATDAALDGAAVVAGVAGDAASPALAARRRGGNGGSLREQATQCVASSMFSPLQNGQKRIQSAQFRS